MEHKMEQDQFLKFFFVKAVFAAQAVRPLLGMVAVLSRDGDAEKAWLEHSVQVHILRCTI